MALNTMNINEPQMKDRFVQIDVYCGTSVGNGAYETNGSLMKGALFMIF